MALLRWKSSFNNGLSTAGSAPVFYTPSLPALVVTVPCAGGPGDVLERTFIRAYVSWSRLVGTGLHIAGGTIAMNMVLGAEVYPVGSPGVPDPTGAGGSRLQNRASADARPFVVPQGTNTTDFGSMSTDGWSESAGIRGPAAYGGGTPELRVSCFTWNITDTDFVLQPYDAQWTFQAFALWRTP